MSVTAIPETTIPREIIDNAVRSTLLDCADPVTVGVICNMLCDDLPAEWKRKWDQDYRQKRHARVSKSLNRQGFRPVAQTHKGRVYSNLSVERAVSQ